MNLKGCKYWLFGVAAGTLFRVLLETSGAVFAGGVDIGNGGDSYSLEFVSYAKSILQHWDELGFDESIQKKEDFNQAIHRTRVTSSLEPLFVNGVEVDAKNYPPCKPVEENGRQDSCGLISVNRLRWDAIGKNGLKKAALVLHEYLGVIGIEARRFDDYYEVTASQVFSKLHDVFEKQKRVDVQFFCSLETWNVEMNRPVVIETIDTYASWMPDRWFESRHRGRTLAFRLVLNVIDADFLAPVLTNRLTYQLYRAGGGAGYNSERDIMSSAEVDFKRTGKRTLRILSDPELQLSCYRVFEGER